MLKNWNAENHLRHHFGEQNISFPVGGLFSIFDTNCRVSPLPSFLPNSRYELGIRANTKAANSGRSLRIIREKDNLVYLGSADRGWLIPLLPCYFAQSFLSRSSHRTLDRHLHSRSCWNQLLVVFSYTNRISTEMVSFREGFVLNATAQVVIKNTRLRTSKELCVMVYFWSHFQLRAVTWYCSRMHNKQTDISINQIINFIVQW